MPPLADTLALDRRRALQLLGAGVAAAMARCSPPPEEIVPYARMRERLVPGEILRFASATTLSGYGRGVIGLTHQGKPTKLEGNRDHPASLGGTDVFIESELMNLYDPSRSRAVRGPVPASDWDSLHAAFAQAIAQAGGARKARLRLLTGRITQPTCIARMEALLARYPNASWHRYEPVDDDNETAGLALAFGRKLVARPRLQDAKIVLCLGADPLGPGPDQPAFARAFARRRRSDAHMMRLYACESVWTLTGANADHRLALAPSDVARFAWSVAENFGVAAGGGEFGYENHARVVAEDLQSARSHALVIAGRDQPPELHALAAWLNWQLLAPVDYIAPVDPVAESHAGSFDALHKDLSAHGADALLIVGANPVYDRDRDFARAIGKAPFSAHMDLHETETGKACQWHMPMSHILETWSDPRGPDGTAAIAQPLITPLYDSRSPQALIAMLAGEGRASDRDLVRATWRANAAGHFEDWWRGILEQGVIPGTAAAPAQLRAPKLPPRKIPQNGPFDLVIGPDPCIWDGRFAANAWLQECPKPFTKEVWGNSIALSEDDARKMNFKDGDRARLSRGHAWTNGVIRVRRGQANGVIALPLGYGRRQAGEIGTSVGFDAHPLLRGKGAVAIEAAAHAPATHSTFGHADIEGELEKLFPQFSLAALAARKEPIDREHLDTLLPKSEWPPQMNDDGYAWAMVIDNSLCIGCNACVVACQAENNVPVVGPHEIDRHREMHWLRIDTYERQGHSGPRIGFEPVPCMHCENAPCEPVCPVEASVHDDEGLNVQVYNRCIGTRFCQANCPYKVRRFNWFDYTGSEAYADMNAPIVSAQRNPDVTVRDRGVMEKCTYCVQRIARAEHEATKENRKVREGEVVTACQAACPAGAISFGNRDDGKSRVAQLRKDKRHFALMNDLGTRPRTTYLASVFNPNPAWERLT